MKTSCFRALILAAAFAIAGCAATTSGTSPPGTTTTVAGATAERTVFAAKSAYAVALTAAVAYKRLPVCAATPTLPCSSPVIVAQLQKADNVAAGALDAAEAAVRTPSIGTTARDTAVGAATAALAALNALVATLGATP